MLGWICRDGKEGKHDVFEWLWLNPAVFSVWQLIQLFITPVLASKQSFEVEAAKIEWSLGPVQLDLIIFSHLPWQLSSLLWILRICQQAELLIASIVAFSSNGTFRHSTRDDMRTFQCRLEHKHNWNLPYAVTIDLATRWPFLAIDPAIDVAFRCLSFFCVQSENVFLCEAYS